MLTRRIILALGSVAGMGAITPAFAQEGPSGTVFIEQTQIGLIIGASWGKGTLKFAGRTHQFKLKGLGVGELGIATIQADGEVYGLKRIQDFPGSYAQAQMSATAGFAHTRAGVRLSNRAGVRLHLRARRQGLQLTLGGDGIIIEMA